MGDSLRLAVGALNVVEFLFSRVRAGGSCTVQLVNQWKKEYRGLISAFHGMDFNDPGTGFAGIIFILPAGIARPPPAENTLAELRDRMGS